MRIVVDNVWSEVSGDTWELQVVEELLAVEEDQTPIFDEGKFPTGLVPSVLAELKKRADVEVIDQRQDLVPVDLDVLTDDILEGISLWDFQKRAAMKILLQGSGIAELPTGSGKTEVIAAVLKVLSLHGYRSVLCIINRTFLVQQTIDRFLKRGLGDTLSIGQFADGIRDLESNIVVATTDSIYSAMKRGDAEVLAFLRSRDVLVADECHHMTSLSWARVAASVGARWRFGVTATMCEVPGQYGYEERVLEGFLGPLLVQVPAYLLRDQGYLAPTRAVKVCINYGRVSGWSWTNVYKRGIIRHQARNSALMSVVCALWRTQRRTLILVGEKVHGHALMEYLSNLGVYSLFVQGGGLVSRRVAGEVREEVWRIDKLASYVKHKTPSVVIATQVLDEGVDIPHFDIVVLAIGMKKNRVLLQRLGRGMRPKEDGGTLYVIDFEDQHHIFLRKHSRLRFETYERERIPVIGVEEFSRELGTPVQLSYGHPYTAL